MIPGKISKRYAKALMELCDEDKSHDKVNRDLSAFLQTFNASTELQNSLRNPSVPNSAKRGLVEQICHKLGFGTLSRNFVNVLLDRSRIEYLEIILTQFQQSMDARAGRIRAYVTSAVVLGPDEVERIRRALAKNPGVTHVTIETEVDPSLLGGVITKVGNTIFDGSVKNRLAAIREHLTATH